MKKTIREVLETPVVEECDVPVPAIQSEFRRQGVAP